MIIYRTEHGTVSYDGNGDLFPYIVRFNSGRSLEITHTFFVAKFKLNRHSRILRKHKRRADRYKKMAEKVKNADS